MALSAGRKLILAKIESTAGTAETAVAEDAILAVEPTLTPLVGGTVCRDLVRSYYGASEDLQVGSHQQIEFSVELAASGTAGTPPQLGKLLQACGMAETSTTGRVEYAPVSGQEKTLTVICNWDGQQHTLSGCRGTWKLTSGAQLIPRLRFTFLGKWNDPSSVTAVEGDYRAWRAPTPGSPSDTPTFELHGKSDLALSKLDLDYAVQTVHREVIGAANDVMITGRHPAGSIAFDAPTLSSFNAFTTARAGTTGALKLIHGGADSLDNAGKLIEINCPKVQFVDPRYRDEEGVLQIAAGLKLAPNTGNDEVKFTFR